jgi:predicted transcriptional regulator
MIQNIAKKGEVIKEIQQEGRQKQFQFTVKGESFIQGLLGAK